MKEKLLLQAQKALNENKSFIFRWGDGEKKSERDREVMSKHFSMLKQWKRTKKCFSSFHNKERQIFSSKFSFFKQSTEKKVKFCVHAFPCYNISKEKLFLNEQKRELLNEILL